MRAPHAFVRYGHARMAHRATLFQRCTAVKKVDVCSYERRAHPTRESASHTCRHALDPQLTAAENHVATNA
jgi:hypothetical protein